MRPNLLLILASLLLAGCASDPDAAPAPGSPAPASPTPAPPAFAPIRLTHEHATQDAASQTFEIPEGVGALDLRITFAGPNGAPACAAPDARIEVKDPSGATFAQARAGAGANVGGPDACGGQTRREGVRLAPGTWTVSFSGRGAATGVVEVAPAG